MTGLFSSVRANSQNRSRFMIFLTSSLIFILLTVVTVLNLSKDNFNRSILNTCLFILIILTSILVFLLVKFFLGARIIDKNAELLSQGLLNIDDIIPDKTRGLETLTAAFNDMKRNLLSFIESTKSNVIILSDAIDKVTKSLDMSFKGNEHIASNMATVAEKTQQQLKIVNETLAGIQEVAERANNITNTLGNIEAFVKNTVQITKDGAEHVDKFNEQMDVISTNLSETAAFIETLNTYLNEIDQVNNLIINITEQLKLLSLNSAVEAARAGEAGKGFAVVAQEMNKLSMATRSSVGQISKLLNNILNSNSKVSESIKGCVESFNISKEIFNAVKESFYTINKNTYILSDDMKKVYDESRLINENTKGISNQGQVLYDASNEISSITQDVAAVTQESLAENEEINNQALSLQNMLSGIDKLLKRYKTSIIPVEQDSQRRLKIALFSPMDHPFWEGVRQGALYAKTELKSKNVDVEFLGFQKLDKTFRETIKEKIENKYDGIILPGFIDNAEEYVNMAKRKNVAVMAYNCDFNEGIERVAYFGSDIYGSGKLAGQVIAKALSNEGQIALIRGSLNTSSNRVRRDAIYEVMAKMKKLRIATEIEVGTDSTKVYKDIIETLNRLPNLSGFIILTRNFAGVIRAIEERGLVGKIKIVCLDIDNEVKELIKKGIIYAAIGQDPFGQGHDPIIAMYNYLVTGEKPESVSYTRTEYIDIRNVGEL